MVAPASKNLLLQLTQVNEEDPVKFNYKIGSEFLISAEKVEFKNYDGQLVTVNQNFLDNPVFLGKIKQGSPNPTIYYDPQINSVQEKQLEIHLKDISLEQDQEIVYTLANTTITNPTGLLIDKTPVLVAKGMIFDVGGYLMEVEEIEPAPTKSDDKWDGPSIYFNPESFSGISADEQITKKENDKKKGGKGKKGPSPPEIVLKILDGVDQDKDSAKFASKSVKDELLIRIGSQKDCDVVLEKLLPEHLKIRYNPEAKRWLAFTDGAAADVKTASVLYLVNALPFKAKELEKGHSYFLKIRDGMRIGFGGNIFGVQIK